MTVPKLKRTGRGQRRWPSFCGGGSTGLCCILVFLVVVVLFMTNLPTEMDHAIGDSELSLVLRNQGMMFARDKVEHPTSSTSEERILSVVSAGVIQENVTPSVLVQSIQKIITVSSENNMVQETWKSGVIGINGVSSHSNNAERVLVLRPHQLGLNNQLQCIHIAGVLALQYNRTLIVPPNGYDGSKHAKAPIPFYQLFDETSIKVPLRVLDEVEQDSMYLGGCNATVTKFVPEYPSTIELTRDPNPEESCLVFECKWGDLHHATPKDLFPQVDQLLFPLHPRFRTIAERVVQSIHEKTASSRVTNKRNDLKLLGMHVRQGDTTASPLFDCQATKLFPRLEIFDNTRRIKQWRIMCADGKIDDSVSMTRYGLSWPRLLTQLLWKCPDSWPLCAKDFDAVFIATNDLSMIQAHREKRSKVFTLQDFPFVGQDLCSSGVHKSGCDMERIKVEEFLVEEMILTLCNVFQPSMPSTVTDIVLHMRLHEEQQHDSANDKRLYEAHDKQLFEFKHVKKLAQLKKSGLGVAERMNENNNVAPSLAGKVLRSRNGTGTATNRKLVLRGDESLMMECRSLASLLAKHDNRVLLLPPEMSDGPLLFNEVYDETSINITIAFSDEQMADCSGILPTNGSSTSEASCVSTSCTELVDNRAILLGITKCPPIDLLPIYWFLADKIIHYIKIHSRKWNKEDFTILAIHMEDDSSSRPLRLSSNDTTRSTKVTSFVDRVMHCDNQPSSPVLCAKDFDAVFVATADGNNVLPTVLSRAIANDTSNNVFGPDDFVFLRRHLCKGKTACDEAKITLQEQLVYQLVMIQASAFQTSSASLRSDFVLRMRSNGQRASTYHLVASHRRRQEYPARQ